MSPQDKKQMIDTITFQMMSETEKANKMYYDFKKNAKKELH